MSNLPDWPRPQYADDGCLPFLFFVVYGADAAGMTLSRSKYRCDGIPPGIDLMAYGPDVHPEVADSFRQGYLWEELVRGDIALAKAIAAQTGCVVVQGNVADATSLNYLRDVVGLLTCLLDSGGVAIFDPQNFRWWSPSVWRERIFNPGLPVPREHAVILVSPESDGTERLHTRGMRKFGRPDISVHRVPAALRAAAIEMCNRFIEHQAAGGVVAEGEQIRMKGLPPGMHCVLRGDEQDPDFNNRHIEVLW